MLKGISASRLYIHISIRVKGPHRTLSGLSFSRRAYLRSAVFLLLPDRSMGPSGLSRTINQTIGSTPARSSLGSPVSSRPAMSGISVEMDTVQIYPPCCREYTPCSQHFPQGLHVASSSVPCKQTGKRWNRRRTRIRPSQQQAADSSARTATASRYLQLHPVELLHLIAGSLYAVDQAFLAYTCHRLNNVLGAVIWPKLKHDSQLKWSFLQTIHSDKDHRGYLYRACHILHPRTRSLDLSQCFQSSPCIEYLYGYKLSRHTI